MIFENTDRIILAGDSVTDRESAQLVVPYSDYPMFLCNRGTCEIEGIK